KPREKIVALEDHEARAIAPRALQLVAKTTVGKLFEACWGERGTSEIASDSLDALAIASVDPLTGVDVEAPNDGDAFVGASLVGLDPTHLRRARGEAVAAGKREIVVSVGGFVGAVERAAVLLQQAGDALGGALSDRAHVVVGRVGESMDRCASKTM